MPISAAAVDTAPQPLQPTLAAHLFPPLGRELVALLRALPAEAWDRATVCRAWTVKDIAAHLLDTALRRLSVGRDAHLLAPPPLPITGYRDLVGFLNGLNAEWVTALRRVSPQLLTELLAWVEPPLAEHLASIDPWAPAVFGVAWAGEETSPGWFDVARELTERWHHQQQIRLAAGAPPLDDPRLSGPVLETFLRALPHRYREVAASEGATLVVRINGRVPYVYTLRRDGSGWTLLAGEAAEPAARIVIPEEPAWLLLTKGMTGEAARARAAIEGEPRLAAPFFGVLAVMA